MSDSGCSARDPLSRGLFSISEDAHDLSGVEAQAAAGAERDGDLATLRPVVDGVDRHAQLGCQLFRSAIPRLGHHVHPFTPAVEHRFRKPRVGWPVYSSASAR